MTAKSATLPNEGASGLTDLSVLRDNWVGFLVRGILAIALGAVAILSPFSALIAFAIALAAFAFIDGAIAMITGIKGAREKSQRWWALALSGLAGIMVAAFFVLLPLFTTLTLAIASIVAISVWAVLRGVFDISAAVRLRKEMKGEWLLGLSGMLSLLIGLGLPFLLVLFPGATILSLGWLIGVYAIAAGVLLIGLGFRLRSRGAAKPADKGTGTEALMAAA